jgi:hypothetical protein
MKRYKMNTNHLDHANELILKLTDYIVMQRTELAQILEVLKEHQEFLDKEIKRLENEC